MGAINLPTERLGYTYTICTAGGSLSWDDFRNASGVTMKQSLSGDLRRLTRVSAGAPCPLVTSTLSVVA